MKHYYILVAFSLLGQKQGDAMRGVPSIKGGRKYDIKLFGE